MLEASSRQASLAARRNSSLACSTSRPSVPAVSSAVFSSHHRHRRRALRIQASGEGNAATPNPSDEGPKAISLARRLPGPEITFVLAGFLKIVTIGGLASSAPVDAVRTAAGKMSPYLMVPVGLLMCWVAKFITDNELQENKKFMSFFIGFLVLMYFGLYRLLFRYDPDSSPYIANTPSRAASSARLAQVRAQMGDRDLLNPSDSRSVSGFRKSDYDDQELQEARYQSYQTARAQRGYEDSAAYDSMAEVEARNPARRHQRRL